MADAVGADVRVDPWYRRRGALVGATAVLAAALGAGGLVGARALRDTGGLPLTKPQLSNVIGTFKPGQDTFSAAFMAIRDKGKDIEIVDVEARTSPNVERIDVGAMWPRDIERNGTNPGNGFGFPVEQLPHQHPAFGTPVSAEELDFVPKGWESDDPPALWVVVGFRLTSGEVGAVNGIRVTYRFGGKTKSQFFEHAVVVCQTGNNACRKEDAGRYGEWVLTQFGLVPEGTY